MLEKPLIAFGEVLWDIFPDGKKLGGAPLNFSYYFKRAGGSPLFVSAVGNDNLGNKALREISKLKLDISYIQQINKPTGRANVSLEPTGEHRFEILRGAAWENISYSNNELIKNSLGIYFGTVGRVSNKNRITLDGLIKNSGEVVFLDLNLRDGLYNMEDIKTVLTRTNYLKLNNEEAIKLREHGIIRGINEKEILFSLIEKYRLKACVITLGKEGAIGGDENETFMVKGIKVKRGGDTVGCGDAFAAVWLASLLKRKTMEESLRFANEVASKVASERGAIVEI